MEPILVKNFKTRFGDLLLGSYNNQLCLADWRYRKMRSNIDHRIKTGLNSDFEFSTSTIIEEAQAQLTQYFEGKRFEFNLPITVIGTDFQKTVWRALQQIPYGKTETYLGLSKSLGNEKAIRAVASANGANALSIIIPCHRIIGSNHDLVGYAGGITAKKALLELENPLRKTQISLFD